MKSRDLEILSNFCFFWKNDPSLTVAYPDCAENLLGPAPTFGSLIKISSKLVHFRRSYCRTREDRFCLVEYLQYKLFEHITNTTNITNTG